MKIWITRLSAGSLHAGGLDRVHVWFTKPVFVTKRLSKKELSELPWMHGEQHGLGDIGWEPLSGTREETRSLNFAKVFGYSDTADKDRNKLANFVWKKLYEHFNNKEFPHGWYEEEKAGRSNPWDFLLEVDFNFDFKCE